MLRVGWPAAAGQYLTPLKLEVMNFFFLHPFKIKQQDDHPLVALHETPDQNTSEGGEFLDDGLRMEDMVLTPAEISIAAGSPEKLL